MWIKSFEGVNRLKEIREVYLWRYYYPAEKLKRILEIKIY
jgi:hypothetical protein